MGGSAGMPASGGLAGDQVIPAGGVGGTSGVAGAEVAGGAGVGGGGGGGLAGSSSGGSAGQTAPGPIDYSMWMLQLPIGTGTSPTTISPSELLAGFENEYFYPADDGGQMFMDPETGITTPNSTRCRTEMREATPDGKAASWGSSGINRMTVEGQVVKLGESGAAVTIGQILNGTDSIPLCELEYSGSRGGFVVFYEEARGAGTTIDLDTPYELGERYTFTLELSAGVLTVSIDGEEVYSHTPSAATVAKQFYFKFGNYDQSSSSGPISTVPYSIVEAYKVDVIHQ
ncbi:MAG TPA: polysaccharide lyase family 7 protein [Polyangiaceae bacterium]|nr:polysaccharide lyase family 7 protein [Polyangiaceae bacterium]